MITRAAIEADVSGMSGVLREIIAHTGRERPSDQACVNEHYVANPASVRCTVAIDDAGTILGFQSLIRAAPGNRYDVPVGWGIIGTHISPRAHRQGVGRALFAESRTAAERAGLVKIDAFVAADNPIAVGYYEAMGFRTYRTPEGIVQKMYSVAARASMVS